MIKKSLVLLFLVSLVLVQVQGQVEGENTDPVDQGNITEPTDQGNATAPEQNQNATTPEEEGVDWTMLRGLLGDSCSGLTGNNSTAQNQTAGTNSTTEFAIPDELQTFITGLGLNFDSLMNLNATDDFHNWDVVALKSWMIAYINYHNAAAQAAGQGSALSNTQEQIEGNDDSVVGGQTSTFPMGWNATIFGQILDFTSIWNPEWDADGSPSPNKALNGLQTNPLLYETFAFQQLLFGPDGVLNNTNQNQTESTQGGEEQSPGFLQEINTTDGITPDEAFPVIDDIIKEYSLVVACNIAGEGQGGEEGGENVGEGQEQEQQPSEGQQPAEGGQPGEEQQPNTEGEGQTQEGEQQQPAGGDQAAANNSTASP